LVFACGSCDSHRRPATLSCHRTSLYIRWSSACRRCFPGDFRPRAARPGFFRARFVFSALPVAATPCGSRYSLGTTQVRGTYAAEAVLPGVGSRRLAAVGQRFLFSPSNRADHFALRLFRSLRFHLPDIVRVLAPAPCRCRHWADVVTRTCDQLSLVARLRQAGYVTLVPFTVASEGVFVTQCCNLFHSLNAALSNNAHSIVLTAATW
jgi:hypothetical protein